MRNAFNPDDLSYTLWRFKMDHSIKDKVVLITGGAKNLGGLLSQKFAEAGAKVSYAEETVQLNLVN